MLRLSYSSHFARLERACAFSLDCCFLELRQTARDAGLTVLLPISQTARDAGLTVLLPIRLHVMLD